MESNFESHPIQSLSLFSGTKQGEKFLILVAGKRMALSSDSVKNDPWRNKKKINLHYIYEPLNLSAFTNLEKVW